MQAPAVRIRRRCDTSTRFDYNRSHLTPSPALPTTFDAGLPNLSHRSGQIVKLRFSRGGYWIYASHPPPEPLPLR
jgi:hypothetical protein